MLHAATRGFTSHAAPRPLLRALFDVPSGASMAVLTSGPPTALFGYALGAGSSDYWTTEARQAVLRAQRLVANITEQRAAPLPLTKAVKMLDALSDQLCSVLDASELVLNVHPSQQVVSDAAQGNSLLTSYMNSLNTDVKLYNALKASIDAVPFIPQPTPSQQTISVADLLMRDFQKSGIHLGGQERSQFVKLSDDILSLGNKFTRSSSILSCESVEIEAPQTRLAGINPSLLARLTASSPNLAVIPMNNPHITSHIQRHARDEHVRRLLYVASHSPSPEDVHTLEELMRTRMKLARVLGKSSYADMWLGDKMAQSPERVMKFLESVSRSNWPLAKEDLTRLETVKRVGGGGKGGITAWDESFYTQFLTPAGGSNSVTSADEVRPYFSVGTTMEGISNLLQDLYGIRLEPATLSPGETWHDDVKKVHVVHETEGVIGVVYFDLFAREKGVQVDKFEGAAQFTVRCSRRLDDFEEYCGVRRDGLISPQTEVTRPAEDGTQALYQLPIVVLVTQFERPTLDSPGLLSLGEVETLFHEMGHVIHSVLARTDYQHISGTRCALDFVEVPSNLLESFARDANVLERVGVHYGTGQKVPGELIQGVKARQGLLEAMQRQKQVKMAVLDQLYHSEQMDAMNYDSTLLLAQVQSQFDVIPYVEGTQWQTQFSHLYSYGASYYSYFWARRVSDSIRATVFGGAPQRGYDRDRLRHGGEVVRQELLKWGGGRDPWVGLEKAGIDEGVLGSL
ncbi:Mitochondrial intermediate peptidase [Podochytrium sp. JEL0797]|nr:Mitochondrial intermediate peptidase [Podochytrium sp. JEL0797]